MIILNMTNIPSLPTQRRAQNMNKISSGTLRKVSKRKVTFASIHKRNHGCSSKNNSKELLV